MRGPWVGFTDVTFLLNTGLALLLASVLGAIIAYHPASRRTVDTLEEVEAQKVFVLYAAIGAITGTMVTRYGTVVGFVVFGIGGLIRFRTDLRSAAMTGRVIFVTLIGLACGLQLPHLAVLATVFGFALIAVLEAHAATRIVVKHLSAGSLASASEAYRSLLEREGCRVIGVTKSFTKEQVAMVFRAPRRVAREQLARKLEAEIPDALRGAVDWETE
jgi:hypothetical protein